ncbi:MAG TPA: hypothetical protein VLT86_10495 [Vicinamibacterales bacterium]|nr:hypothetical protein [Vicinamibacterales bacterium]
MTGRVRLALAVAGMAVGLAAAGAVLHARDSAYPLPVPTQHLLYLRSSRAATRMMLSFKSVASDVYWIRAIQHYGRERKSLRTSDRFDLLQPLLDLTTTLDPRFNIAYRFGAIFLSLEPPNGPARPDQAIALLQKGLAANPDRWQYAHDIGFIEYWYTGDYRAAAGWFDRAAKIPGAPDWIRPLAAVTLAQGGDRTGARRMLEELRGSEEKYVRDAAERGLMQLQALDAIDELQGIVEHYFATQHAYPAGWSDMFGAGKQPYDPARAPFVYDPATHTVTISPDSPLNPLPKKLQKK